MGRILGTIAQQLELLDQVLNTRSRICSVKITLETKNKNLSYAKSGFSGYVQPDLWMITFDA